MRFKYPRTPHLPWSLGSTDDDKILQSVNHFVGQEVVVSVKMDGENTTLYNNYTHARSLDSRGHVSRDWVKALQSKIGKDIPEGWRFCGENLFAVHSISYSNLKGYFYLFSIWNEENKCLSFEEMDVWAKILEIPVVPVLYRGIWDEEKIKSLYSPVFEGNDMEGYVVRLARGFSYDEFGSSVAKFVRKGHVQTSEHWMNSEIKKNQIR